MISFIFTFKGKDKTKKISLFIRISIIWTLVNTVNLLRHFNSYLKHKLLYVYIGLLNRYTFVYSKRFKDCLSKS